MIELYFVSVLGYLMLSKMHTILGTGWSSKDISMIPFWCMCLMPVVNTILVFLMVVSLTIDDV